jgi:putative nucleotidyltransferase with HDIG domain
LYNSDEDKIVARLAELLAIECGISSKRAEQIYISALLHDVGKAKLPAGLINKPDKLTAQEFEIMKTHTTLGAEMLKCVKGDFGEVVRSIALYHHERRDNGGYWGKSLSELPCYVEIVAISDIFVALVSPRPYKKPWPLEDALDYIRNQAGGHFSHDTVNVFLRLMRNNGTILTILKGG